MRREDRKREWRNETIRKLEKDVRKTDERDEGRKRERSHTVRSHKRRLIEGKKTIFEQSD